MVSPHLEAERDRLLQLIQAIRDSGSVAPINVWISPAPKGKYLYYKLSSKNPEYKNQYLGKAGSEKYCDWKARIRRIGAATFYTSGINRSPGRFSYDGTRS